MGSKQFTVPGMAPVALSVCHVDIDAASPLNQNESHIHRACEIYVNLSGDVAFEVENRIYPISRGSVIITRPLEYHHCIYRSQKRHEHYWITFTAQEEDFLQIFFHREKGQDNLIQLTESQLLQLCALLEALPKTADPLRQRILCLQLFAVLNEGTRGRPEATLDALPEAVAKTLRFMDDHLAEDLSVHTLAKAGSVSVNTLERHFKSTLGASPSSVLRKKRLIASMACLRGGNSVTEAALKCGFSDYSNYIQLFRKQFGMTPLQYKKEI